MLKTQSRFLDRKYKGPFIIEAVIPTNVVIQLKDDSAAEELCVCRQCVLLCSSEISQSTPWIGHTRKRCKLWRCVQENNMDDNPETTVDDGAKYFSRGHQIRTPARFLLWTALRLSRRKGGKL